MVIRTHSDPVNGIGWENNKVSVGNSRTHKGEISRIPSHATIKNMLHRFLLSFGISSEQKAWDAS